MKYAEEIFKSRNPHFSSYEDTESLSVSAKGVILKDSVSLLLQEYQRKQNGNCSMTYKKTEHIISMTRMNRKNFFFRVLLLFFFMVGISENCCNS